MMDSIQIYNINKVQEKTDVEVLRELAKKTYANCRKITTEDTYSVEQEAYFYNNDKFQLGKLEVILLESAEILIRNISYRPQKELLKQMVLDLKTGSEDYFKPLLVEDVINDMAYQYFSDLEYEEHKEEPVFHMEYIISKFKPMVNLICKVLKENDLEGRLYR